MAGHFALAGFLLALATIKPQLALPVAGWLVLWAVSDWRRRQVFVWSFGLTTAIFLAASEYVLPGWIGQFRDAVAAYRQYTGGAGSLLDVLATPALGKILAAAAVIAVAVTGWYVRHASHDSVAFSTMLALVLAVTLVIVPTFAPYNQVLLLPAVFLIAASWKDLWTRNRLTRARLRSGIAGGFLALARILWTDAGFALLTCEFGSKGLGCAPLYQSGYSPRSSGIACGVRQRSIEDLLASADRYLATRQCACHAGFPPEDRDFGSALSALHWAAITG